MPILGITASSIQNAINASSYESIATATGTGSSATITFSSIPSTYVSLQLRIMGKGTYTGSTGANDVFVTFNGDTGANYTQHRLYGDGSAAGAAGTTGATVTRIQRAINSSAAGLNNMMGVAIADIHDYASTTKYKTMRNFSGVDTNGVASTDINLSSGLWLSTSAINSITLSATGSTAWATSTVISLYGIKG